jgi:hypothetical protein
MAFFLRKPYLYIIIGILLVVIIIFFSGIFGPEQFGLVLIVSPLSSSIQMGQNTPSLPSLKIQQFTSNSMNSVLFTLAQTCRTIME